MRPPLTSRLAEHFELLLTVSGVLVAVLLTLIELDAARERLSFIFLLWLQGFILWAVRRHSCLSRRALLDRIRGMLQDRVNNQLTVMLSVADTREGMLGPSERLAVEQALVAARTVSTELSQLSMESLRIWESRYGHVIQRARLYEQSPG
ncbi:MAG: hypothetical protein H0W67_06760 [Gemmatimonadales bacterium]|nr:hypothetical protein [Gemmatimonadales bacterium]